MEVKDKYFFVKLIAPLVFGLMIFILPRLWGVPSPEGCSANAWLYFSIFMALILGLILEPVPPAFIGLVAVVVAVLFKVGPKDSGIDGGVIKAADAVNWGLSGFSNSVVWLIFAAFTIGLGFSKTGLGERIALYIVSKLGKSTLGLGYAIALVDLILAPFIPSNAARSGGTVYPVITSIAPMFDSYPDKNPRKIGGYLIWVGLASACVSSSIFLTGQAPNPLALTQITKGGAQVVNWISWFLAFLPVGIILFILTPLLAYYIYPPEVKGSAEVLSWAKQKYQELGKITRPQVYMVVIALLGLVLWVGSSVFKINATTTALLMIVLMVASKVISWQDFLNNKPAWGTFVWFGTLVAMAGGLKNVGFLDWLAHLLEGRFDAVSPTIAMLVLLLFFSWLRYFFASGTAYVTAVMLIFVALVQAIPGINVAQTLLILILPMGFMGIITPYGTGCSPLWFGSHYIKGPQFFLLGGIFAAIYMIIYIVVGIPWIYFITPYLSFS
ncbi:DASS family sodium-coupled anion symporter [Helicobacter sp. MIT 05-5293]|uniref:DASS family sodium-coupled anion symporter n=1 Tax=Helicobacter sp. MIT 05-5293 TaxID=1548149 RepID=UPI00051E0AA4|nr:DASS family sodium-coupled anion symporter [Helicobacter sp. MIT 05-5293]TLD81070.1 DASS family sodium-coupled anion symporter [Helicobacter sp. MIT 05-5293]